PPPIPPPFPYTTLFRSSLLFHELVADCFLAVADEQLAASHDRVIPRLSFDRLEPAQLLMTGGIRLDERDLALFREHEQEILVGQDRKSTRLNSSHGSIS